MKKKINRLIFFLLSVSLLNSGMVRADYWTQKANYPGNGSSRSFCFSIGDKGYIGCGDGIVTAGDFWQYDTTLNVWNQKAAFGGGGRWSGVSFGVGGYGYAGLGWSGGMMDDIWKYDPVADTWTQMNNFPAGQRQVPASFVIGSKAYIATGRNNSNIFQNDLWEYDPAIDAWSQKASLPGVARSQPFAFSVDSLGYVGGGFDQALNGLNDFFEYSQTMNTWTVRASLPAAGRGDPAGFAIGCRGYAGTGQTLPVNTVLNDFWEFNPASNTWIAKASFGGSARDESAFFSIGGKGYLGLGGINGSSLNNDFWEYTPDTTCITTLPVASFIATNHVCPGTCTDFTNMSVNGTSFQWIFSGATPGTSTDPNPSVICYNTPGQYPVTLIATNAFSSDTLTLNNFMTVYPYPAPQGIMQNGDTLFANQGAVSYQWYHDGVIIPGATDYFYIASEGGDYNIVATDANNCEVEAAVFDVIAQAGSVAPEAQWAILQNPVGDKLTLMKPAHAHDLNIKLKILDAAGKLIFSFSTEQLKSENDLHFDVSGFDAGIYFLQIQAGQNSTVMKFLKK